VPNPTPEPSSSAFAVSHSLAARKSALGLHDVASQNKPPRFPEIAAIALLLVVAALGAREIAARRSESASGT
jgi:hypothetical protein